MKGLMFKLKSSKVLFVTGVWITIVIGGFAVFKDRKNESFIVESERLIMSDYDELKFFFAI